MRAIKDVTFPCLLSFTDTMHKKHTALMAALME